MNSSSALALVFGVCFVAVQIEVIFGAPTTNDDPALLVISFDAFRPDYFERNVTPNLNKIRQDGLSAPFLLNVFPTKTFVNHHTIATVNLVSYVFYIGRLLYSFILDGFGRLLY